MPVYNKLVRDLIPQFIENAGSKFTTRTLDPSEHLTEIKKKLYEEVKYMLSRGVNHWHEPVKAEEVASCPLLHRVLNCEGI